MCKILRNICALILLYCISFPVDAQESLRNDGKMQMHSASIMAFYGDFINEQTFNNNLGSAYFVGPALQTIQGLIKPLQFDKVILDNSNSLLLRTSVLNTTSLDFKKGMIATPKATPSINWAFGDNATYTNAANNRHVLGYVSKIGNDSFAFPIGDGTRLRMLAISAPKDTNSILRAAYFKGSPSTAILPATAPFPIQSTDPVGLKVSNEEYWDLDGSTPVQITLTWDVLSHADTLTENEISRLVVVGWNGTHWVSLGAAGVTGNLKGTGSITSRVVVPDSFAVYTLGVAQKTCISTSPILSLGPDISVCKGEIATIKAGKNYVSYEWQDGSTDSLFKTSLAGTYWVKAWDNCGNYQIDTIQILRGKEISVTAGLIKCNNDMNGKIQLSDTMKVKILLNNEEVALSRLSNLGVGTYRVQVSSLQGCSTDTTVEIKSIQGPRSVEIGKDTLHVIEGESLTLNPTLLPSFKPAKVDWLPKLNLSCDTCLRTEVRPTVTSTYAIEVTDAIGCVVKDNVTIYVDYKTGLYIPNAFNPESEGFTILGTSVIDVVIKMQIFDRWGTLLFEANGFKPDGSVRWNGMYKDKPLMRGTYVVTVEAKYIDGTVKTFAGEFLLSR